MAEFAAAQATAWKDGLAGWGIGPDRIAALEAEQRAQEKALDKRGVRKPRAVPGRH